MHVPEAIGCLASRGRQEEKEVAPDELAMQSIPILSRVTRLLWLSTCLPGTPKCTRAPHWPRVCPLPMKAATSLLITFQTINSLPQSCAWQDAANTGPSGFPIGFTCTGAYRKSAGVEKLACHVAGHQGRFQGPVPSRSTSVRKAAWCACKLIGRPFHTELRETQMVTRGPHWGSRLFPVILSHGSPGKLKSPSPDWGFNHLKVGPLKPTCSGNTSLFSERGGLGSLLPSHGSSWWRLCMCTCEMCGLHLFRQSLLSSAPRFL